MRKTFILLGALAVISISSILLQACCEDKIDVCYAISHITLDAYDNAGESAVPADTAPVIAKAFFLSLTINSVESFCSNNSWNLISTAYALTKRCKSTISKDIIQKISITSNKDFDQEHPAGTELNNLFHLPGPGEMSEPRNEKIFRLYLLRSPDSNSQHTFFVTLTAENGRVLTISSKPVNLIR